MKRRVSSRWSSASGASLTRFLSPQVAALISSDAGEALLAGHRREITVVFCDLRRFTAFSEGAEPEEVLSVLRDYHAAMGPLIVEHGGTLERFAGDGMMIYFNDPLPMEDHAARADPNGSGDATGLHRAVEPLEQAGTRPWIGVGIAVGYATLGRIGFEGRFDYAAIGSVVNLAARLCAEASDDSIVLNQRALSEVEALVTVQPLGALALKGFSRPVTAFDVIEIRAAGSPEPS